MPATYALIGAVVLGAVIMGFSIQSNWIWCVIRKELTNRWLLRVEIAVLALGYWIWYSD